MSPSNTPAGSDTILLFSSHLHGTASDKAALDSQHANTTSYISNTHINHTMQAGPVPLLGRSTPRPYLHTSSPCLFLSLPPGHTQSKSSQKRSSTQSPKPNHHNIGIAHISFTFIDPLAPGRIASDRQAQRCGLRPLSDHTLVRAISWARNLYPSLTQDTNIHGDRRTHKDISKVRLSNAPASIDAIWL